jgi:hypothetical protein
VAWLCAWFLGARFGKHRCFFCAPDSAAELDAPVADETGVKLNSAKFYPCSQVPNSSAAFKRRFTGVFFGFRMYGRQTVSVVSK